MSTSSASSAVAVSAVSELDANEFKNILKRIMVTLRDRTRNECKSDELSRRFQEAVNLVDVAGYFDPKAVLQKFLADFLDPELVTAVRQRDAARGLAAFRRLATSTPDSESADLLAAIGQLSDSDGAAIMPWKLLDDLFREGTAGSLKTDVPVSSRVLGFNALYEDFIANMSVAFPTETSANMVEEFRRASMFYPSAAYDVVRELCTPYLATALSGNASGDAHKVLGGPNAFFGKLPYIENLSLYDKWDVQVLQNQVNADYLRDTFVQMVAAIVGLPPVLTSMDFRERIQEYVKQALGTEGTEGTDEDSAPKSAQEAMSTAMGIVQRMISDGTVNELLGDQSFVDVDMDLLTTLTQSSNLLENLPEDVQIALNALSVNSEPIFNTSQLSNEKNK